MTKSELKKFKAAYRKHIANDIKNSKDLFEITDYIPKNVIVKHGKYTDLYNNQSGKNITSDTLPFNIKWNGINSGSDKEAIILDFNKWVDFKYGDWTKEEIEAKFGKKYGLGGFIFGALVGGAATDLFIHKD